MTIFYKIWCKRKLVCYSENLYKPRNLLSDSRKHTQNICAYFRSLQKFSASFSEVTQEPVNKKFKFVFTFWFILAQFFFIAPSLVLP